MALKTIVEIEVDDSKFKAWLEKSHKVTVQVGAQGNLSAPQAPTITESPKPSSIPPSTATNMPGVSWTYRQAPQPNANASAPNTGSPRQSSIGTWQTPSYTAHPNNGFVGPMPQTGQVNAAAKTQPSVTGSPRQSSITNNLARRNDGFGPVELLRGSLSLYGHGADMLKKPVDSFVHGLKDATKTLAKFTFGVGVAATFSVGKMSSDLEKKSFTARGLGLNLGQKLAFENAYRPVTDPEALLSKIQEAQVDLQHTYKLFTQTTGMKKEELYGKSTTEIGGALVQNFKTLIDQLKSQYGAEWKMALSQRMESQGWGHFFSAEDATRLERMPAEQVGGFQSDYESKLKLLEITDKQITEWTRLNQTLDMAGNELEINFMKRIIELSPELIKLTTALKDDVNQLIGSDKFKDGITSVATGLHDLGNYLSSEKFTASVKGFVEFVEKTSDIFNFEPTKPKSIIEALDATSSHFGAIGEGIDKGLGPRKKLSDNLLFRSVGNVKEWVKEGLKSSTNSAFAKMEGAENFLTGLILHESGGNPNAKNPTSSAAGIGQITKATAQHLGINNVYDPKESVMGMIKYLDEIAQNAQKQGDATPEQLLKGYHLGANIDYNRTKDTRYVKEAMVKIQNNSSCDVSLVTNRICQ